MEKQTGTSDQRILPGMAKWTSCRNDSVKNGGMRLELNTQEFGGARQKPGSFKGLPEGGIRKTATPGWGELPGPPLQLSKPVSFVISNSIAGLSACLEWFRDITSPL